MFRQALPAIPFAVFAVAAPSADANEVCVSCSGPEAVYRCTVDQSASVEAYRYGKRILQFVCISELARQGNHQKCRVQRGEGACIGIERTVSLTAPIDAAAEAMSSDPPDTDVSEVAPLPPEEPAKAGPPKTVEELARRTASSSKEQIEKTGSAVGGAMKKGWHCLTSLFTKC